MKIKPINAILTKLHCSEVCPKKYAFTKLMKFNFIRKSVDATVYVRKMEARASRDYNQNDQQSIVVHVWDSHVGMMS